MKRIALIEDDNDIAFTVRLNLEREGYKVAHFARGQDGLAAVQRGSADFVILDLNLPDLDGLTLCRELRRDPATQRIPILMLTARGSERDRVTGLELGADDYLTKPFSIRELVARVAAVWRRTRPPAEEPSFYEDAELKIDEKAFRVFRYGREVKLAKKEFELLWLLVQHRGSVVSRDRILSEVWQMSDEIETRTVDAHIRNIRKKIGTERISTIVGFGYRYDPPAPL
ncbi:MAG: response regulator transcription factor [Acidobacteria bacterium]|nr:response regulator transcription factor [Acidobacteriota bacterium]MBV9475354.1 response regulator transcription factor [Acidobacteriota bacterium]